VRFWLSSVIECVRKHIPLHNISIVLIACPAKVFVSCSTSLRGVVPWSSPVTTEDVNCFDTSQLNINTSAADFL